MGDDGGDLTAELTAGLDRVLPLGAQHWMRHMVDEGSLVCIVRNIDRDVSKFGSLTAVVPSLSPLARKINSKILG